MRNFWEITFSRWERVVGPFSAGKQLKPFQRDHPHVLKELAELEITDEELKEIEELRKWTSVATNGNNKLSDTDLRALKSPPGKSLKGKLALWHSVSDLTLIDQDPLAKVHTQLAPPVWSKCPSARMMYRHFDWFSSGSRTKQVTADLYAVLCVLGFRFHVATTGRLLLTPQGRRLRTSFIAFLSRFCQPTLDTYVGPAPQRSANANILFCSWDDHLLDDIIRRAQAAYGEPDQGQYGTVLTPAQRTTALARRKKYESEIQDIVRAVEKASSSSAGPRKPDRVHTYVHQALQGLVCVSTSSFIHRPCLTADDHTSSQALLNNVDRLETRLAGYPSAAPYVVSNKGNYGDAMHIFIRKPYNDDATFQSIDDFAGTQPSLYEEFLEFVQSSPLHGEDDVSKDVTTGIMPQDIPQWAQRFMDADADSEASEDEQLRTSLSRTLGRKTGRASTSRKGIEYRRPRALPHLVPVSAKGVSGKVAEVPDDAQPPADSVAVPRVSPSPPVPTKARAPTQHPVPSQSDPAALPEPQMGDTSGMSRSPPACVPQASHDLSPPAIIEVSHRTAVLPAHARVAAAHPLDIA